MNKRLLAIVLAVVMILSAAPESVLQKACLESQVTAATTLQNPKIVADSSMVSGQKVTYDCVWFGSYPQTEIVDQASTCGTYGKSWYLNSDYEENSTLFTSLKNASGWDSNGDIIINEKKYRRIKASDSNCTDSSENIYYSSENNYNWKSTDTYHYFRYEPIKWRVLSVNDNQVLLLADKGLDNQLYNKTVTSINWKTSTIRSWLNGYDASINTCAVDYSGKNFINSAFSFTERNAINPTYLDNMTTGQYSASYGGDNTTDKVFLLSSYDLFSSARSASYGFYKDDYNKHDEARQCKTSTYAKAMGAYASSMVDYLKNGYWWTRSPGSKDQYATFVGFYGYVIEAGRNVDWNNTAVRPALYLNLSSSDYYSYAGTVCTDGTVNEIARSYTVTFDANGGSGAPADQTKTDGIDLTLSTTAPNRSGYTFVGWGTSSNATTAAYNAGGTYSKDANITLYAIWKKTITLTYNANGGSGAPASQSATIYNAATDKIFTISDTQPSRDGYTFIGWGTSLTAASTYGSGEQISLSDSTTLYAIWKEDTTPVETVTLTYSNTNGGENIPASRTVDKGSSVNLSGLTPKKDGYTFVGWNSNKNATSASYAPGDMIDLNADLTLYAIWEKTITLSYDANRGSGAPSSQTKTIYNTTTKATFTIDSATPTREDYSFLGWGLSENATNATYAPKDAIDLSSDLILYAVWEKKSSGGGDTPEPGGDPVNPDPIPAGKKAQSISAENKTVPINNGTFNLEAKTSGDGKLTYKSSNTKAATVSSAGKITIKGYGITTITITAAETSAYKKAMKTVTITVVPKKMKLKSVKSPKKGYLQAKWAKDKKASGYQLQISEDWKFNEKEFKVFQISISAKKTSVKKSVKSILERKKSYYVRIRSYKKVSGKKLYGIWSYGKVVKIK